MLTIAYQGWCYGRRCDFRASCLVEICSVKLLNAMKSLHGQLPRLSQPLRFMCNDGNDAPPEIVQNHFQSEFRRRAEAFFVAVFFASSKSIFRLRTPGAWQCRRSQAVSSPMASGGSWACFSISVCPWFCGCCFLTCKHEASILLEIFGEAASSLPIHIVGFLEAQCWRCTDLALWFQSGKLADSGECSRRGWSMHHGDSRLSEGELLCSRQWHGGAGWLLHYHSMRFAIESPHDLSNSKMSWSWGADDWRMGHSEILCKIVSWQDFSQYLFAAKLIEIPVFWLLKNHWGKGFMDYWRRWFAIRVDDAASLSWWKRSGHLARSCGEGGPGIQPWICGWIANALTIGCFWRSSRNKPLRRNLTPCNICIRLGLSRKTGRFGHRDMGAKCSYFLIQVEWLDNQEVSEVGTELTRKLLRMQFNNLQQPAVGCCTTFEKLFHPVLALTFQGEKIASSERRKQDAP